MDDTFLANLLAHNLRLRDVIQVHDNLESLSEQIADYLEAEDHRYLMREFRIDIYHSYAIAASFHRSRIFARSLKHRGLALPLTPGRPSLTFSDTPCYN